MSEKFEWWEKELPTKTQEEKWGEEANLLLEKCEKDSNFAVGFHLGYKEACRKRQEEIERLKKRIEDVEKILKYAVQKKD